ncbi:MAG: hypothetical protein K6C14_01135 [Eubacterium sp.]|nr:hypothetical protein [Eubacterium sp.]
MIRYYLRKLLIFALSMVIAVCLFILSFGVLTVGLFHSDAYVESGLKRNTEAIAETVTAGLKDTAAELEIPEELLTSAVNDEMIKIITDTVAHNFIYNYTTSFSNSTELYNLIASSVSAGAPEYGKRLSDVEISKISSCAVDSVNESLGNSDTSQVSAFSFVKSRTMMLLIIVSVIAAVGSIIALDMLNNGRHRKYNYIGMGVITAGAASLSVSLFALFGGFLKTYRFCTYEAYDNAIKYCFKTAFSMLVVLGVIMIVIGFVMLLRTYIYFKRKKEAYMARRLSSNDTLTDYMDDYYTKNTRTHVPGEEFEKDVKKIDFD